MVVQVAVMYRLQWCTGCSGSTGCSDVQIAVVVQVTVMYRLQWCTGCSGSTGCSDVQIAVVYRLQW